MHPNHLRRVIARTKKQIAKQKAKSLHSADNKDKLKACDELKRLRGKMLMLQELSNERG